MFIYTKTLTLPYIYTYTILLYIHIIGYCYGGTDGSTALVCVGGETMVRNYSSSDCSGSFESEVNGCDQLESTLASQGVTVECTDTCGSGQCEAVKLTTYNGITGCDGDSPSGYDSMEVNINGMIDYCNNYGFWSKMSANSTHIYSMLYSESDCSGTGSIGAIWMRGSYCDADSSTAYMTEVTSTADVTDGAMQYGVIMAAIFSIFAVIIN